MYYQTLPDLTSAAVSSQGPSCSLPSSCGDLSLDVHICHDLSKRASTLAGSSACSSPVSALLILTPPVDCSLNGPLCYPLTATFCSLVILVHGLQLFSSAELSTILIKHLCLFVQSLSLPATL